MPSLKSSVRARRKKRKKAANKIIANFRLPIANWFQSAFGNWKSAMKLIVGLGNPGSEYAASRHNLGFMLIDKLAADARVTVGRRECSAFVGRAQIENVVVKLAKPQTYMNLSGQTVSCLIAKHPAEPRGSQLIVINDDLALRLGTIRIRERGSAGGHNGLKS